MIRGLRQRLGHPIESTLEALAGKWKPALLEHLKDRLPYHERLAQLVERFRADVRGGASRSHRIEWQTSPLDPPRDRQPAPAGGQILRLYLVRPGLEAEGDQGGRSAYRPLTEKGRRRFQKTARAFARMGCKIDLILTSPLVRAVQTAEILAGAIDHGEVAILEALDPGFEVEAVRRAIAARAGKARAIAIVGHEPQLSSVLAALSGVPRSDLDLKKGAIVRVDAPGFGEGTRADPRWWLKPKGARVKGLPLRKQVRQARAAAEAASGEDRRMARNKRQGAAKPREGAAGAHPRG